MNFAVYSAPVCLYVTTLFDSLQFNVIHFNLFYSFYFVYMCTDSVMSKGKFLYMRTDNKVTLYCIVLYCRLAITDIEDVLHKETWP